MAQLYVTPAQGKIDRPEKELKGFERIPLAPGESRTVTLELSPRDFAYWDTEAGEWHVGAGQYTIRAGDSSDALPLSGDLTLRKDLRIPVSE